MKLKLQICHDASFMQIRVGRSEPEFNGTVAKTLVRREDGVSVGVTSAMEPVFVYVDNALGDPAMNEIHKRVITATLTPEDNSKMASFAINKMMALLERYTTNLHKQIIAKQQSFNQAAQAGNLEISLA